MAEIAARKRQIITAEPVAPAEAREPGEAIPATAPLLERAAEPEVAETAPLAETTAPAELRVAQATAENIEDLRERYNGLMLKVLSLLQRDDPPLARDLSASREALWTVLADPVKFAQISGGG